MRDKGRMLCLRDGTRIKHAAGRDNEMSVPRGQLRMREMEYKTDAADAVLHAGCPIGNQETPSPAGV